MVWSLPFPPLQGSSGFFDLQHLARLLSLLVLSASSPPISVYSADLLQCLVPHRPSPIVRPSESYQPSVYRPTNVLFWFTDPASHTQVCTPPRPVRLVVLGLGVGGGAKETAPPAVVLSLSSRRQALPFNSVPASTNARVPSRFLRCPSLCLPPPPPFPVQPYLSLYYPF